MTFHFKHLLKKNPNWPDFKMKVERVCMCQSLKTSIKAFLFIKLRASIFLYVFITSIAILYIIKLSIIIKLFSSSLQGRVKIMHSY